MGNKDEFQSGRSWMWLEHMAFVIGVSLALYAISRLPIEQPPAQDTTATVNTSPEPGRARHSVRAVVASQHSVRAKQRRAEDCPPYQVNGGDVRSLLDAEAPHNRAGRNPPSNLALSARLP